MTPDNCTAVRNGGLKIYTTIDLNREEQAQSAIDSHEGGTVLDNQPAAALASIDPTNGRHRGAGLIGHLRPDQVLLSRPVPAPDRVGLQGVRADDPDPRLDGDPDQTYYTSKFLPAGWEPADPNWSVHTAEQTYQGTISVTKATTVSDNTVFAQLAADEGWDKLDATAHAMGITSH